MLTRCEPRPQLTTFKWLNETERFGGAVGREPSEDFLFKKALGSLGAFYSHAKTQVFMLTAFPGDYYDDQKYMRSGNCAEYLSRGFNVINCQRCILYRSVLPTVNISK